MTAEFLNIATTPNVRAVQAEMGSASVWERFGADGIPDHFSAREMAFIAARDHFFMASVSQTGWPYVQHRGGPAGFLNVLDDRTLAFADYRGNRQYISTGNLRGDDRVALILLDHAQQRRLKIYARVEFLPADPQTELAGQVLSPGYRARPERIVLMRLVAFDWNCPQHITPRFTEDEIIDALHGVRDRLTSLEQDNARLRAELALASRQADRQGDQP